VEAAQVVQHPGQLCRRPQPPSDGQRFVQAGSGLIKASLSGKRERQILQQVGHVVGAANLPEQRQRIL